MKKEGQPKDNINEEVVDTEQPKLVDQKYKEGQLTKRNPEEIAENQKNKEVKNKTRVKLTNEERKKRKALKNIKGARFTFVDIDSITQAEARKAADNEMAEISKSKNIIKRIWKGSLFKEYYRQKEYSIAREKTIFMPEEILRLRLMKKQRELLQNALCQNTERLLVLMKKKIF
jgi:hypothetical protein